jgi:DnaJ homolog subfamily C member 17
MPSDAHQQLAASAEHDFYGLLGVPFDADESAIKREYRKSSIKYHPDKNPDDAEAASKFQLLSDAREILLDSTLRTVYDNAVKAREQKKRQFDMLDAGRRRMKEDLENREKGFKRKQEEELILETKIRRMAEEGRRRRHEMDARRVREAVETADAISHTREAGQDVRKGAASPGSSPLFSKTSLRPDEPGYQQRVLDCMRSTQEKIDAQSPKTVPVS